MKKRFFINPDIKKAETLPATFYRDADIFKEIKEKIFVKSWHWIGDENLITFSESVFPLTLLENYLDEPILLSKDKNDNIRCMTNVCTHRGNIVVQHPAKTKNLMCSYHGRRFELDGTFKRMPEFSETENFPRPCDNLHQFPIFNWKKFLFTSLDPMFDLN